jgi:hypothetical protein
MLRPVPAAAGRFSGPLILTGDGCYGLLAMVPARGSAAGGHFFIDIRRDFFQNFLERCDGEKRKGQRAPKKSPERKVT